MGDGTFSYQNAVGLDTPPRRSDTEAPPSRWRYSVEKDARPERASADYPLQSFCIYTVVPCDEEACACKIEMGWDTKTFQ